MAPTRAPRTTRGSRTCQTMVTATAGTDRPGCQGSRVSSASPTVGSDRSAGPTATPMATAATRAAAATAIARPDRTRGIVAGAGAVSSVAGSPGPAAGWAGPGVWAGSAAARAGPAGAAPAWAGP